MPDSRIPSFIIDDDQNNESLFMHDIARLLRKSFDRRARKLALTRTQWYALAVLRRNPGINQAELADMLEVEPMTIARLIDRLEETGWVERRADAKDRRAKLLFLTPRVHGIIVQMRALSLANRAVALEGVTEEEHKAFVSTLRKIKANLQK